MSSVTTMTNNKLQFLRRVLQANGLFCAASGLIAVVAAGPLATFLGLPEPLILVVTGIILVPYGLALFWIVSRDSLVDQVAIVAIVLDIAWVLGSIVLLLSDWVPFTTGGMWAVALIALIVADFAGTQIYALNRVRQEG